MFISRWNIHLKSARVNGACAVGIRRVSLTITCESPVSSCRQTRRMHTENWTFLILETLKKLKIKNYLSRLKDRKFVLFKQAKTMQPASRPNVVHDSVQIGWIQMQVVDRRVSRCWLRLENLKLRCCSYPLDNSLRAHRRILELDFSTSRTHLIDYVGLLMLSAGKSVWIGGTLRQLCAANGALIKDLFASKWTRNLISNPVRERAREESRLIKFWTIQIGRFRRP